LLHREGIKVSEKVVRRIMKQEKLTIRQKYNSYKSEITPSVEDIIDRDFRTTKPNQKWLTDITEFSIKAGKVYLSPIID
jgi:putative transposase